MKSPDHELEASLLDSADAVFSSAKPQATGAGPSELTRTLGDTGFLGLGVKEAAGGSGGTVRLAALVAEAAGRHAAAFHYLPSLIGAHAAAAAGDRQLTDALVAGTTVAMVFFGDASGAARPAPSTSLDPEVFYMQGNRVPVQVARGERQLEPDHATWLAPDWFDLRLRFDAPVLADDIESWPNGLVLTHGMAAAAILGLVRGLLTSTTEYVTHRKQFDAPIGSFQAIKHSLADVHIDLVHTRALVFGALDALDSGDARATRLLLLAKIAADRSAAEATRCLQAMGGIGFTWESDVHRYLKQALRLRQWPVPHQQLREWVRPGR
jgi:alkylation response protein AidB-like acyl-CoA dehydrogenase